MSHHFDTKLAKEDPRLNVCDLYLFQGAANTTVMAMTVNPDVGLSASDTLHLEFSAIFRISGNRIQRTSKRQLDPFRGRRSGEERIGSFS